MNSFHPALISQMLLMTYLWSQPERIYWSERQMIWCVCAGSERTPNREGLKCTGVYTSLYFPYDQTPPRVKGQRSFTHPRSLRINIAPELIQFPDNSAYTQKWNPFTWRLIRRGGGGEANRMNVWFNCQSIFLCVFNQYLRLMIPRVSGGEISIIDEKRFSSSAGYCALPPSSSFIHLFIVRVSVRRQWSTQSEGPGPPEVTVRSLLLLWTVVVLVWPDSHVNYCHICVGKEEGATHRKIFTLIQL